MALSFVGVGTNSANNNADGTPGLPASIQAGDLLLLLGSGSLSGRGAGETADYGSLLAGGILSGRAVGEAGTRANVGGVGTLAGHPAGVSSEFGALLASGSLAGKVTGFVYEYGNLSVVSANGLNGRLAGQSVSYAGMLASGSLAGRVTGFEFGSGNLQQTGSPVPFTVTPPAYPEHDSFLENDIRYHIATPGVSDGVKYPIEWADEGSITDNDLRYLRNND